MYFMQDSVPAHDINGGNELHATGMRRDEHKYHSQTRPYSTSNFLCVRAKNQQNQVRGASFVVGAARV